MVSFRQVTAATLVVFIAAGCQRAHTVAIGPRSVSTTTSVTAPVDTSATDPPAPSGADDLAFANQLILQLAELPHGWSVQRGSLTGSMAGAFVACLAARVTYPVNSAERGHSFGGPGYNEIVSGADVFPFPSEVSLLFSDLRDSDTIACLDQAWTGVLKKFAQGPLAGPRFTIGDTKFAPLDFPSYAQGVIAFRGVAAYSIGGVGGTTTTDLVFLRHRRTVASFLFTGTRVPIASDTEQHDVKLVADRMVASSQG